MKHSDLKIGMKVKRVRNFNTDFYTSTKDNVSTVFNIYDHLFNTEEDGILVWEAEYFEPAEEIKEEVQMKEDNKITMQYASSIGNAISMDKKYRTRCGYPVRVLCVDKKDSLYPVLALVNENVKEFTASYTATGFQLSDGSSTIYDLIEVSPWEDFKKDDKVMVSTFGHEWVPRYFAYEKDGAAYCYADGTNSWTEGTTTSVSVTSWMYCRKPTQEELGEDQQNYFDNGE